MSKKKIQGDCFIGEHPMDLCRTITYGWAVGAERVNFFPEDTGYPIGGDTDYKYFVVEVHYDNPERKIGFFDDFAMRFYTTSKLRKHELGVMTLGTDPDGYSLTIPPGSDRYTVSAHCYSDCIAQVKIQKYIITSSILFYIVCI